MGEVEIRIFFKKVVEPFVCLLPQLALEVEIVRLKPAVGKGGLGTARNNRIQQFEFQVFSVECMLGGP